MFTNASFMPDEIYVVTTPVVKINQLFLFGNRTEPDIRFVDYRILSAEFSPGFYGTELHRITGNRIDLFRSGQL